MLGKSTGYFYNISKKKGNFDSHKNISYGIPLLARLSIPHYQKT